MRMIRSALLLTFLLISGSSLAQAPQGINYQAVMRGADGTSITNQLVHVRLTIMGSSQMAYRETHLTTTNNYGLVNLTIGQGTPVQGFFADIDWSSGPYSVQMEADVNGGENFVFFGSQQL